jgi:hypothetical protein
MPTQGDAGHDIVEVGELGEINGEVAKNEFEVLG